MSLKPESTQIKAETEAMAARAIQFEGKPAIEIEIDEAPKIEVNDKAEIRIERSTHQPNELASIIVKIDLEEKGSKATNKTPAIGIAGLKFQEFVVEFLGNFFITTSIYFGEGSAVLPPAMVGLLVTVLGPVSGAHFNPTITLLVSLIERHHSYPISTMKRVFGYILAQFLGTVAANVFNCLFLGWWKLIKVTPGEPMTNQSAVGLELFLTFTLVMYACAAYHPNAQRESFFNGIAFFVLVSTLIACTGSFSGAVMNPAFFLGFGSLNLIVAHDVHNFLLMLAYAGVQVAAIPIGFLMYKFFLSDAMFPLGEIPSLKDKMRNQEKNDSETPSTVAATPEGRSP